MIELDPNQDAPSQDELRALYSRDAVVRAICDHMASRNNNQTETKLDRIVPLLEKEGHQVSRSNVIAGFRRLEAVGCGQFVEGRRGRPTRFVWTTPSRDVRYIASTDAERTVLSKLHANNSIPPSLDDSGQPMILDNDLDNESSDDEVDPEDTGSDITQPFDPTEIRIETKSLTVDLLVARMQEGEIDLAPDFQRKAGLWKEGAQSRLIESLLTRIPLPAFYMDATNEDRWLVVDGLQRLTVLNRFIIEKKLKLSELEFLVSHNGAKFDDLPRNLQRRIKETQVVAYLIQPGTPPEVKFNIFKRINTGGLPLSPQEIRHALNQGPAADMLEELADEGAFFHIVGRFLKNQRMTDRECVLRFLAFVLSPFETYDASRDLDGFLHEQMRLLNEMQVTERDALGQRFQRAMTAASAIFGTNAFRKRYTENDRRKPINKALFEAWSVNLDRLSDTELDRLVTRKGEVIRLFVELMGSKEFEQSISQGTGDARKVKARFGGIRDLLQRAIG